MLHLYNWYYLNQSFRLHVLVEFASTIQRKIHFSSYSRYSGIQVFSKTKTHGIHKENFYNNIYNNIIIGLKLMVYPIRNYRIPEYPNTPSPGSKTFSGKEFHPSAQTSYCFKKSPYRTIIYKKISYFTWQRISEVVSLHLSSGRQQNTNMTLHAASLHNHSSLITYNS